MYKITKWAVALSPDAFTSISVSVQSDTESRMSTLSHLPAPVLSEKAFIITISSDGKWKSLIVKVYFYCNEKQVYSLYMRSLITDPNFSVYQYYSRHSEFPFSQGHTISLA